MIREFKDIYKEMQSEPLHDERFTVLELIKIFDKESSWCGTNYQLIRIKEYSQEITGVRSGDCVGCTIQAMKNMVRFVNSHELLINLREEEEASKNLYKNRRRNDNR